MTRRCILQIGTEKTGTTTLQTFLARNRDRLAARGVRYPRFAGEINQTGLAAYAMDDAKQNGLRAALGLHVAADLPAFRARFERAAAAELGTPGTVILCNEHCHSRLTTPTEVQRLKRLLEPHFDRIEVSVYLRRQDQVGVSLYSTRLKSGASDVNVLPLVDADDPVFNYDLSLKLWEAEFGRQNVHVRLFDRRELTDGDIVADFLAAWNLGTPDGYRAVARMNESIGAEAQEYLRRINVHLKPVAGLPLSEVLGPLVSDLARHFPGKGVRPSRAEAKAFLAMFRDSNEAVRRRHFPHRETLFDEDFEAYPEEADCLSSDADAVAAIAARLQTAHAREILRLEAEIRIRDGRLAWERGDEDGAVAILESAVALLPDHPDSHRTLAEYLVRIGRRAEALESARRATELRPRRHEYWHFLGVVLRQAGDAPGATKAQERALELNPDHEPTRRALDSLRAELGRGRVAG